MLGLFIGFSLCSLIEIVYWFGYKYLALTFGCEKKQKVADEEFIELDHYKMLKEIKELQQQNQVMNEKVMKLEAKMNANKTTL